MNAYAVIETGGKQYRVEKDTVLSVELLGVEPGQTVEFDQVLATSDGVELTIGTPVIESAKVVATVIENFRDKKVYAFKKKRRKGYRNKKGHRQSLTKLKIETISA